MTVSVLGMGNVLMGDDGAGPYAVASLLANYDLPPEVTVLDIGTPGLDLVPYLAGIDTLLLIDTVYSDAPAGAIRSYDQAALLLKKVPPRLSPHDPAVGTCLSLLELEGQAPQETLLIGIVPHQTKFGPGLSKPVQDAIPAVIDRILAELAARGLQATPKRSPAEPDIWWEQPVELGQPLCV